MGKIKSVLFAGCFLCGLMTAVSADGQRQIHNYGEARKLLWSEVYKNGGETLYCGVALNRRSGLNVEHVVPASWMTQHVGCGSRKQCRRRSAQFNRMEGDLHNLYPSRTDANSQRGSLPFGEIAGERHTVSSCDFEADNHVAEPRPAARGEIARAMLYMAQTYGVKLPAGQLELMRYWHEIDPPGQAERIRNERIERIQGNRNPFVD
ncbi:MAG: endonuclease [Thiolinea sp.]